MVVATPKQRRNSSTIRRLWSLCRRRGDPGTLKTSLIAGGLAVLLCLWWVTSSPGALSKPIKPINIDPGPCKVVLGLTVHDVHVFVAHLREHYLKPNTPDYVCGADGAAATRRAQVTLQLHSKVQQNAGKVVSELEKDLQATGCFHAIMAMPTPKFAFGTKPSECGLLVKALQSHNEEKQEHVLWLDVSTTRPRQAQWLDKALESVPCHSRCNHFQRSPPTECKDGQSLQTSMNGLYCLTPDTYLPMTQHFSGAQPSCTNPFMLTRLTPQLKHLFGPSELFPGCEGDNGTALFERVAILPNHGRLEHSKAAQQQQKACDPGILEHATAGNSLMKRFQRLLHIGRLPPHCIPFEAQISTFEFFVLFCFWLVAMASAVISFGYFFLLLIAFLSKICICCPEGCCDDCDN
uniref:Uncharacterized protein n=1 Tax=Eutreptiella gymnastica TaxID=73025 RepID=A0A7S1J3Q2_9EUGL